MTNPNYVHNQALLNNPNEHPYQMMNMNQNQGYLVNQPMPQTFTGKKVNCYSCLIKIISIITLIYGILMIIGFLIGFGITQHIFMLNDFL